MQRIYKLKGVIMPYAWGGTEFIPSLTGIQHNGPAAEYWLGTHPLAPSVTEDGKQLQSLIMEDPQYFLGDFPVEDGLPFLLKVQDVKDMLSIQVHPRKEEAREGFERENKEGIPVTAPNRNYKDPNEKSEMAVALGDFWLLHGFKPEKELKEFFAIPEFSFLSDSFNKGGYRGLFTTIMEMEQAKANEVLSPLAERVTLLFNSGKLTKSEPDFWAAKALQTYFSGGNIDKGIFCIYLMNIVNLKKGEGIYQPAGLLHAYLEGQNIEVMTNSDNVLRAALTPKHIDIPELLKHVDYTPVHPQILKAASNSSEIETPSKEFLLSNFKKPAQLEIVSPCMLLVIEGQIVVTCEGQSVSCHQGEAAYIVPGSNIDIEAAENVEFFTVTVPKKQS